MSDAVEDQEIADGESDSLQKTALKKEKKHDNVGVADLEKVTDYVEEKEISSPAISDAMAVIGNKKQLENMEKAEREKELARVKIRKEDVELIMSEMMISKTVAERNLRVHRGDVVATLAALTN
ncbi:PREDICTED: huntingtin-interacting protein K-like [Priapulus caudatus]|uniref:Huntingtin-interacting protein K-like n=1 Tax=Priapulus caudatus TaxID=37621 RepID=A0ABM1FBJ9_PRICU|nr:PREDICTED: huntingtin-interacting protein K-like [Priapulus caudatus]